ncbi:MFS transporter [Plantactinospora sp. GCM10030261]|uniref:MFS transporter n=1 Tax=Plantactinospora sp. GCM10030261 TaxID=3273420 RepID=UPI0036203DB7
MLSTMPAPPVQATRQRAIAALVVTTAAMNAAMAVASPVGTILAADRLGTGWAGLPNTAGIVGTGLGALLLTTVAARRGWRAGLTTGYLVAVVGAAVAVAAAAVGAVAPVSLGLLLLGIGNAGALLARYAATDHYPVRWHGFAIGVVVWGGAVGAVGGPLLLATTGTVASHLGWPALCGPFLFAGLTSAAAAAAMLAFPAGSGAGPRLGRSDGERASVPTVHPSVAPAERADANVGNSATATDRLSLAGLVRAPAARSAFVVMAAAQVVMVAVMTAAPVDLHRHQHGLGAIGAVMAAHTFGMFALSPITGRLADRLGTRPVMVAGLALLVVSAVLTAVVPRSGTTLPAVTLFLLGYAWNLCFVGGSTSLAGQLPPAMRTRVEGAVDAAVWGAAAVAGTGATALLAVGGQALLGWTAAGLAALPVAVLRRGGR